MSMTTCKECGAQRSTKAAVCPSCGAKVRRTGCLAWIVAGVLAIGVLGGIVASCQNNMEASRKADAEAARRSAMTAEQRQAEDKAKAAAAATKAKEAAEGEAAFQRALLVARAVKASAKDPSSVDIIEALVTDAGAVGLKFRAKNSFGALVINLAVVTRDGKQASGTEANVAALWNKHIANKPARDLTRAIRGAVSLGAL